MTGEGIKTPEVISTPPAGVILETAPSDLPNEIVEETNQATVEILAERTPAETVYQSFLVYVRNIAPQLHYQTTKELAHQLATLAMANSLYHFDAIINVLNNNGQYPALVDIINSTIITIDNKLATEDNEPTTDDNEPHSNFNINNETAIEVLTKYLDNFQAGKAEKKLSVFLAELATVCPTIKQSNPKTPLRSWLETNKLLKPVQTAFENYFQLELQNAIKEKYKIFISERASYYVNTIDWKNTESISHKLTAFKQEINGNGINNSQAREVITKAFLQRFGKNPDNNQRKLIYKIFNLHADSSTQFDLASLIKNPDGPNELMLKQYKELIEAWNSPDGIKYEQSLQTLFQTTDSLQELESKLTVYFQQTAAGYKKIIKDYYGDNIPESAKIPDQILNANSFKTLLEILCYPEKLNIEGNKFNHAQIRIFARIMLEGSLAQRIINCNEDVINRKKYADLLMKQFFKKLIIRPIKKIDLKYNNSLKPDEKGEHEIELLQFKIKGRMSLATAEEETIEVYAYNPGSTDLNPINIKSIESIFAKIIKEGTADPSLSDLLRMTLIVEPDNLEKLKKILETTTTSHNIARHNSDKINKINVHSGNNFANDYKIRPRIAVELDSGEIVYPPSLEIQVFTPQSFIIANAKESPANHREYKAKQGKAILTRLLPQVIFPELYAITLDPELNLKHTLKAPLTSEPLSTVV